jgi:hypothetical protein
MRHDPRIAPFQQKWIEARTARFDLLNPINHSGRDR